MSALASLSRGVTGLSPEQLGRVARGSLERVRTERLGLVASGWAFWTTVAVFPMLVVLLTVYGLVSEAGEVQRQVRNVLGSVSSEAQTVVTNQLRGIVRSSGLGWRLALGVALLLWSASNGMANAIKAIALAYGEDERRSFVKLRGLALVFTVGALVVIAGAVALVAAFPMGNAHGGFAAVFAATLRWVGMTILVAVSVAILYRFAPRTRHGGWEWSIKAAVAVAVAWAAMTALFSLYLGDASSYASTYGTLAGFIVLMLWFYLSALVIVGGAAVAAEMWEVAERDRSASDDPERWHRAAA